MLEVRLYRSLTYTTVYLGRQVWLELPRLV